MPRRLDPDIEHALVSRAAADPDALTALYDHYLPRVFGYVALRVGRAADAEDVTAAAFMKVVRAIRQFEYRGSGSFAAWLFRIAHNEVLRFQRETPARAGHVPIDELPDLESDALLPDAALARKEELARLRQRIAALPPRQQDIVTLRFFGGLRNSEIAVLLGLDERTVSAHLSRALSTLRLQFQEEAQQEHEP
ncbi:MAG: sigma-70 family RNA polymerase sigma factor [Anaerolineae bacterium]|nr:sigma-70 family RNA polymerase sigma factor [Anaerolineae bacterium]